MTEFDMNCRSGSFLYMTDDINTLFYIIKYEEILSSVKKGHNPNNGKKEYFVSLSRDLIPEDTKKPPKKRFGITLDETKLSEKYSIVPLSYKESDFDSGKNRKVKYITAYDDDTYKLNIANWKTIGISKQVYLKIKEAIKNMPRSELSKFRLEYFGESKVRQNGKKRLEQYLFNVKNGGLKLTYEEFPEICTELMKNLKAD